MKFTVNRKVLREYLKPMTATVPKASREKAFDCFLFDVNEDDGFVYVTASSAETALQRKFKPKVETGGKFLANAKLLIKILQELSGDDVIFEEEQPGIIKISGGACTYRLCSLNASAYSEPEMPFPQDVVKVTGFKKLYEKTCAMVPNEEKTSSFAGIHVDITQTSIRAVSCNNKGLAVAKQVLKNGNNMSFTLTKTALSQLTKNTAPDDELEIGISGSRVVFMKEGLLFSTKQLAGEYINVDELLNSTKAVYMAKVEFDDFKSRIKKVCEIAAMGSETSYVRLEFKKNCIRITTENDVGSDSGDCPAVMIEGAEEQSAYYPAAMLMDIFKTVEGDLIVQADKRGYLLVFDRYNRYMMTPMREIAVEKQTQKFAGNKAELINPKKSKATEKSQAA